MSGKLETHPIPYFLALTLGAIGILSGVVASLFWWGAKGQSRLYEQNWLREKERSEEIKRERNESREQAESIRFDHTRDLVKLATAAEGLARVREKLDAELLAAVNARLEAEEHRQEAAQYLQEAKKQAAKDARKRPAGSTS